MVLMKEHAELCRQVLEHKQAEQEALGRMEADAFRSHKGDARDTLGELTWPSSIKGDSPRAK